MARYKHGINGPVSGKVGPVVGASWKGIVYLKGVQERTGRPATEAQALQRRILGLASWLLRMIREVILVGFQGVMGAKTPMNAAIGLLMKEAVRFVDGKPEVDFSKLVLSRGELMISWVRERVRMPSGSIRVSWENPPESAFCSGGDRAWFVFYHAGIERFVLFNEGIFRSDLQTVLTLPVEFSDGELQGYLFFVNEKGDAVSTSLYLGNSEATFIKGLL